MVLAVIAASVSFYAIAKGWIGYMPPVEDLQNPISRFATQVYSADRQILGTWNYNKENRICVDYSELPTSLVQALVATEDARFHDHSGIDFYALGRAVVKRGIFGQTSAGGGSTITQQLVKNLTGDTSQRPSRKIREIMRARYLENHYTKDTIIECYLNTIAMGHGIYGVEVAANYYFDKNDLFQKIPVAIITGVDTKDEISRTLMYPIVDILSKPFNESNVKSVVDKMIK